MEDLKNVNDKDDQNERALVKEPDTQFEGINRVVKDTEEDLVDNMPDSHPEPKPDSNNTTK